MTTLPNYTPFYGGGSVNNPANVIPTTGAPSTVLTENRIGTLAVDNAAANIYGLASVSGGVSTWYILGGAGAGTFAGLEGDNSGVAMPSGGGIITVAGTANQLATSGASNTLTLSVPATFIAPGSIASTTSITSGSTLAATTSLAVGTSATIGTTATIGTGLTVSAGGAAITGNSTVTGSLTASTSLTATLGAITATNGNVVLGTTGNKLVIHATTAASDSIGTSAAMTAGTITVATTAVTAASKIFLTANTPGGTQGVLSAPSASIIAGTSFDINSSNAADTSTVNYWIVN